MFQTGASGYLDGPSTDPEILEDVSVVGRFHVTRVNESFNPEPQPQIILERGSVYTTLLAFLDKNRSICMDEVKYVFKNEAAVGVGPTKEALTLFHSEGKDYLYEGEGVMIPRTSGDQSEVLGQVLYYTFKLAGGFPPFICKPFIFKLLTGRDDCDEEYLIKSYIDFVSLIDSDKFILLSAVNDGLESMSSEKKSILFQVMSDEKEIKLAQNIAPNLQNVSINESNWRQVLITLANLDLLERPACKSVADEFQRRMKMGRSKLYSVDEAEEFIKNVNPTAKSIIDKFKLLSPLSENEKKVVGFLFRFITSHCDDTKFAQKFLMYCTSCTTIPFEPINICFNSVSGLKRAITTNTCDNLLHIPTTYESYKEFKEEFKNILDDDKSFIFSFN